ncbi:MAG: competence protein CoiA family protein [Candidatus Methanoperedens sp.]|nr:competence protein CoiA family protein [Candidatus Methanoperedens sp.]CAG0948985.1 hypothetical protein METP1_00072 [Methanosarcinales archaeon]
MQYAKNENGKLIRASKNIIATCPHCNSELIARCGAINVDHWSHKVECLYNTEYDNEWHIKWKNIALGYNLKVEKRIGYHITDAIDTINKYCYEFQHSPIATSEILSRVNQYLSRGYKTIWIFDYHEKYDDDSLLLKHSDGIIKFKQKWAKRVITTLFEGKSRDNEEACGQLYFDIGDSSLIILVKKLYSNGNGWGEEKYLSDLFVPKEIIIKEGYVECEFCGLWYHTPKCPRCEGK